MACISTLAGHARHPACGRRHQIPGDSNNKETFAAAPVISWNPSFGRTLRAPFLKLRRRADTCNGGATAG